VVIWSGNYVVARGISNQIPPVSLAFYRWATGSFCLLPLGFRSLASDWSLLKKHKTYLFFTAITGISIFNTLIYLAGHYTNAINLALIGTTAAPFFATILAALFLGEHISRLRVTGMSICFSGVIYLLARGNWHNLVGFRFDRGDILILISAFSFAIYNTLVRKKPSGISAMGFLTCIFILGTLLLFPAFLLEKAVTPPVHWNPSMLSTIAYLGIGNSVIGFLCWNLAIGRIGAARTVIFATLIPIFSSVEAVLILGEEFSMVHLISGVLVIAGLLIANLPATRPGAEKNLEFKSSKAIP
jgi:drug/metabolite transporter (DMT)-like permease